VKSECDELARRQTGLLHEPPVGRAARDSALDDGSHVEVRVNVDAADRRRARHQRAYRTKGYVVAAAGDDGGRTGAQYRKNRRFCPFVCGPRVARHDLYVARVRDLEPRKVDVMLDVVRRAEPRERATQRGWACRRTGAAPAEHDALVVRHADEHGRGALTAPFVKPLGEPRITRVANGDRQGYLGGDGMRRAFGHSLDRRYRRKCAVGPATPARKWAC
jgi:hypothetical protein